MRIERTRRPRWPFVLASVLVLWAFLAALLLLEVDPETPASTREWVLLLVVGPPVYVAVEWLAGRLFNAEMGARISPARFSFARIGVALLVALIFLAPFAWWFFRQQQ